MSHRPPSIRELPQRDAERICAIHRLPNLGVTLLELLLNAVEAGARRVVATLSGGSGTNNPNKNPPPPITRACVEDDGHGVRPEDLAKLGRWGFSSKGDNGGGGGSAAGRGVALAALGALSASAPVTFDSLVASSSVNNTPQVMRATFGAAVGPTTQVGLAPTRVQRLFGGRRQQHPQQHGSRVAFAPPRSMIMQKLQGQAAGSAATASEVARAREALAIAALPFPSVHVELVWREQAEEDEDDEDEDDDDGGGLRLGTSELVLEMPAGRSVRDTLAVLFPHAPALTGVKADGEGVTTTGGGGMSGLFDVSAAAPANPPPPTTTKLRGYADHPSGSSSPNPTATIDAHCPRLLFVNGRRVCFPPLEAALARWHACASARAAKQALATLGSSSSSASSYPMAYALFVTVPSECVQDVGHGQQQQVPPSLWRPLAPLLCSALRAAWGDPPRDAEALMAAFGDKGEQNDDGGGGRSRRNSNNNNEDSGGGIVGRKRWRAKSGFAAAAAASGGPAAAAAPNAGPVSAPFALPGLAAMHAESRCRALLAAAGSGVHQQQQQPNDVPTAAVLSAVDLAPPPPPPPPILTATELARRLVQQQQGLDAAGNPHHHHRISRQQQQHHQDVAGQGPTLPVPAAVVVGGGGGGGASSAAAARPLTRADLGRAAVVGQAEPSRWLMAVVPPAYPNDRSVLLAVDPHAADERVLLERLQQGLQGQLRRRASASSLAAGNGNGGGGNGNGDDDPAIVVVEVLGPPTRLRPPQALRLTPQERDALRGGGSGGGSGGSSSSSSAVASALHLWGWAWANDESSSGLQLLAVPTVCGTPLTAWDFLGHVSALMMMGSSGGGGGGASSSSPSSSLVVVPPGALRALRSKACRSALMFGDALEPQQARGLVQALASSRLWTACAHGRPTAAALLVVSGGGGGADGGALLPLPRAPLMLPPPHEVLEALEESRRTRRSGGLVDEEGRGKQQQEGLAARLREHLARCEAKKKRARKSGVEAAAA